MDSTDDAVADGVMALVRPVCDCVVEAPPVKEGVLVAVGSADLLWLPLDVVGERRLDNDMATVVEFNATEFVNDCVCVGVTLSGETVASCDVVNDAVLDPVSSRESETDVDFVGTRTEFDTELEKEPDLSSVKLGVLVGWDADSSSLRVTENTSVGVSERSDVTLGFERLSERLDVAVTVAVGASFD